MSPLVNTVAIAVVLAAPVVSLAQSNQPMTRAQVKAELVEFEKAGYNPAFVNDADFPHDLQAAEARVAAQRRSTSGIGGVDSGSSVSAAPASRS
jgi:hypothetical protein